MRINIAILNQNLRTVEVPAGSTVLQVLQTAELDANRVSEIKRNATVISQGTVLNDGDTILVVYGKIQGGNDVDTWVASVKITTEVEEDATPENGYVVFESGIDVLEMVRKAGFDLNQLVRIKDAEGNTVALDSKIVDGTSYVVVLRA